MALTAGGGADPPMRAAVVLALLLENGADDDGHGIGVRLVRLDAAGFQEQDFTGSCADEIRDDNEAGRVEHIDRERYVCNRCQGLISPGYLESGPLQFARCFNPAGLAAYSALLGRCHGIGVDLSRFQNVSGPVGDEVDGLLYERHGNFVRRVRPPAYFSVAHARDIANGAPGKRVELQSIADLIAQTIEIREQVQILLHRRFGEPIAGGASAFRDRAVKLPHRGGVEIGKA